MAGTYLTVSGLYLKQGTTKAIPATGGEYVSLHDGVYVSELVIADLTTLTTSSVIINDVLPIPANSMIEAVEVIADTAATSGGSATLSVGLYKYDRTTAISETALVSALALTSIDLAGEKTILTAGSTSAGAKVGISTGADPGLISAKYATAAFTAGAVRIRVKWRGIGTITQ